MENFKIRDVADVERFIEDNEELLLETWEEYKYENLMDHFHYDNVDYFDEGLFFDMCYNLFNKLTDFC